jgi:hypothetical protein
MRGPQTLSDKSVRPTPRLSSPSEVVLGLKPRKSIGLTESTNCSGIITRSHTRDDQGREVAAVQGVLASVLGMIKGGATHVGVATDHVIESFSNQLWPNYKTSEGVEPDLLAQFPILEEVLSAAALGEEAPADAGDELGPEAVRTKAEIVSYLSGSFARLDKATEAIGLKNVPVKSSPISPLKGADVTRLGLVVESLVHAFDHYGQMVEYLRMNGVVPPASRP